VTPFWLLFDVSSFVACLARAIEPSSPPLPPLDEQSGPLIARLTLARGFARLVTAITWLIANRCDLTCW
jgi:hypothetical protein